MVAAYALDALSPAELRAFEEHLQECPACQSELRELQEVTHVLPLALEPVEPPSDLFSRIRDQIEIERPALMPIPGGREEPRRRAPWTHLEMIVGLAAVLAIAALGAWNIHLQNEINTNNAALAYQKAVNGAIVSGAHVTQVPSTTVAPNAQAALVQPTQARRPAYMIVQGLPKLQSGHTYEVWLIKGKNAPVPAGTFQYTTDGPQVWQLPKTAHGYAITAVTDEPNPTGNMSPKGPQVLAGPITA
jgi:anti-sigma factor RsiW